LYYQLFLIKVKFHHLIYKIYNYLLDKIISLYPAQSPDILPNAHIAYSAISGCGEDNNLTNIGIAPLSIIVYVYYVLPEATLVKAHADSNYK
jgi:hypothetical protein